MKRFIAQFVRGGFPDLYAAFERVSPTERYRVGEPKPYDDAFAEAKARNDGTWTPAPALIPFDFGTMNTWLVGLNMPGDEA